MLSAQDRLIQMNDAKMPLRVGRRLLIAGACGSLFGASAGAAPVGAVIVGAGSSFIRPVMQSWIDLLPDGLSINAKYTAIGTGTAQSRILAGELDFAAVELPMEKGKLSDGNLIQFPIAFGALTCVANLQGIRNDQLRLTGPLLAAIYAGQIRKWNDPRIADINPGLALPDLEIRPVFLGEPNGAVFSTTHTFTQYLLATNPDWRAKYGQAVTRRWAVGSMTTSADYMLHTLKVLPGSIGYLPVATALASELPTTALINRTGKAVVAGAASLGAAVKQVDWSKSPELVVNLVDQPGGESWPLVLATYGLIQRLNRDPLQAQAVRTFFRFIVANGSDGAVQRGAMPLPAAIRSTVLELLS